MLDSGTPDSMLDRAEIAALARRQPVQRAPVALLGCATAYGAHRVTQESIRTAALPFIGEFEYMLKVLDTSGVEERHLAMPITWYLEAHDWGERMEAFDRVAAELLTSAAREALEGSNVAPSDVDAVVFVTSTGLCVPSPESRLIERLGLRPDVERTPIVGLGCSGGAVGLARAGDVARLGPGRTVLYVGVELCSLHIPVHADEATDVIGLALFGDGAFAAVLRSGDVEGGSGRPARLLASAETWCPNTGDMATVTGRGNALAPDLSPELPEMVEVELVRAIHALLEAQGISPDRLAGYIMHVGSKPMLEQLARKLGVGKAGLAHSFEVLRHHGNNSAASVIYALERTLASGAPGLYVLAAPGPGMCMATVLVEVG